MTYNYDRAELSIHYGPGWPELPKAIFIHSTRSGVPGRASLSGHDLEAQSTYNWFKSPASNASTNAIVSPRETILCVPDDRYAYHAKEHSFLTLSIEVTQALPEYGYYDEQYIKTAQLCHYWCEKFNIPKVYRDFYTNGMEGLTGHEDSEQGHRDVKSDPGNKWNWDKFISILNEVDNMTLDERVKEAGLFTYAAGQLLQGRPLSEGAKTMIKNSEAIK